MKPIDQNKSLRKIVEPAIIAALYFILTFFSASVGLAYSGVQLRLSEALTILPVFTPFAIPGLTIGCFISNIASPFGLIDLVFGTLCTLLSAFLTRLLKDIKIKEVPFLSPLPPVILEPVFISFLICFSSPEGLQANTFWTIFGLIFAGQFIVCYCLGIPFYLILKKSGIFKSQRSTI